MSSNINLNQVLPRNVLVSGTATVCFTGPRPKDLFGYSKDPYYPLVDFLTDLVLDLNQQGVGRFISGGAQGFDQLAFWSVNRAKTSASGITNDVYVPFPFQAVRWRDEGLFGQREYNLMLRLADTVKTLSADPDPDDFRQAVQKLHARNHAMVADSDLVVALLVEGHNTDWANAKGGTAECVRHARANNVPVLAIICDKSNPASGFTTRFL